VATWLLLQIVDVLVPILTLPEWVGRFVFLLLLIGFPITVIFAWAFEMTPEGLKKESDVDRSQSIVDRTGRKLNIVTIGVLSVAVAWFAWDKFSSSEVESAEANTVPAAAVPEVSERSVAVLPFVAMSSGEDDEYFADGLTEEILNSLAQLPELLVTARTSAFSFKGQDLPVQEIAATLGVRHIVEGSVRRAGERLRVTAQLIRAADGFHLWSENYDSTSTDAIAVQENIAEKIAVAMDIVLDEEKRETMRAAGLRDVEAFTYYQKGIEIFNLAHGEMNQIEGLRQANAYFEKVMERVPDFPRTYVYHSDLFVHLLTNDAVGRVMPNVSVQDIAGAYPAAIADYEAAVRHASTTEMQNTSALNLAYINGNWRGLTGRLDQVLSSPSCLSGNWLPNIANTFGYSEQHYKHAMRIVACDPRRSLSWFDASRAALWSGDMEEAQRLAREGMEVAPGSWLNQWEITLLIAAGSFDEANREIESRIQNVSSTLLLRVMMAARQGDLELARQLTERYDSEVGRRLMSIIVRAWSGDRDGANRMAAEMDKHDFGLSTMVGTVFWCVCGAPWDLEATPRFAAKLEEASLPWPPVSPISYPLKDW
jgi:TolB-like protein